MRLLKLNRADILGMALVATVGAVSIITAMVRFGILYAEVNNMERDGFLLKAFVWSCVEESCGQIASCLPAFRVLLRRRGETSQSKGITTWSKAAEGSEGYETELQKLSKPDKCFEEVGRRSLSSCAE